MLASSDNTTIQVLQGGLEIAIKRVVVPVTRKNPGSMPSDRDRSRKLKEQIAIIHGRTAVPTVNDPRLLHAENLDGKELASLMHCLVEDSSSVRLSGEDSYTSSATPFEGVGRNSRNVPTLKSQPVAKARELVGGDFRLLKRDKLGLLLMGHTQHLLKMSVQRADVVGENASRPRGASNITAGGATVVIGSVVGSRIGGFTNSDSTQPHVQRKHPSGP